MNRLFIMTICISLIAGCQSNQPGKMSIRLHAPIVVTGCTIGDSTSSLDFQDCSGKRYNLFIEYPNLAGSGVLSLSVGSDGEIRSQLERKSPLAEEVRHALEKFVTSTLTPDKIEELKRRSQTEKASVVITESEWSLLETLSFIERLKEQPTKVRTVPK